MPELIRDFRVVRYLRDVDEFVTFGNLVTRAQRTEETHRAYVNGVEFPWHIAEEGVDVEGAGAREGGGLTVVRVPLLVEGFRFESAEVIEGETT